MARTTTGPEAALLAERGRRVSARLRIQNVDGTWKELTNLSGEGFSGLNFLLGLEWGTNFDAPTWTGTVRLARSAETPAGTVSIAPLVETSPANVDDGGDPAPLVDGMRRIEWYTTTASLDGAVSTEHKVFDGYVVKPSESGGVLTLSVSDLGHLLVQTQIESERIYDWDGVLLETAIQQVLDDNMGVGVIPLVVEPSLAGTVTLSSKTKVERIKVMEAVRNLAIETVGAAVRYMWNGEAMEFRLFMPPRGSTTSLFTFTKFLEYKDNTLAQNTEDVRNVGQIFYNDRDKKAVVGVPYEVPTSIALYGRRYFEFRESATSQINSEPEARAFITTAITDLATPKNEREFKVAYHWPAEPWDLYTSAANAVQYTSAQQLAVTSLTHTIAAGVATTRFETRGEVAGYSRKWIAIEGLGPKPPNDDDLAVVATAYYEGSMYGGEFFNGKPDGCIWLIIQWGLTMRRLHIWARSNKAGVVTPLWPPTSSDIYKAVTLDRPEGKVPRVGNLVRTSDGATVWEMMVPIPVTPGDSKTFIVQGEGENGRKGKQTKAGPYPGVDLGGFAEPGDATPYTITRPEATRIHLSWSRTVPFSPGYFAIMQDNIVIERIQTSGGGPFSYDIEELHADRGYRISIVPFNAGISGSRSFDYIPAWVSTLTFPAPDSFVTTGGDFSVRLFAPTATPPGTVTVAVEKSVDSGQTDDWTEVNRLPVASFPMYDPVYYAAQFYRYVAYDAGGSILDISDPVYWTAPV